MTYTLHYLDRYRNEGTRTYSKHSAYSEAQLKYQPATGDESFLLNIFTVPEQEMNVYTANPPEALSKRYLTPDGVLFCIHPQVLDYYPEDSYVKLIKEKSTSAQTVAVMPSSSTRTLYVMDEYSHAVKVHFPFRVSRYGRKMRDEVIEQAIHVSLDLEQNLHHFDSSFAYLREVIGVACKNLDETTARDENWGYLVRDMRPFPLVDRTGELIPGFALFGKDYFKPDLPPLLYELIGEAEPVSFVLENIMLPIVTHWVQCYKNFGYMLEPHGQNTLLEVDDDNKITRIVHRDLSLGIDMRLRDEKGLTSSHLNEYNKMDYGDFTSITYDMFMGSHFFDRIIACCQEKYPHLTEEDFRAPCREKFSQLFPEYKRYMPKTIIYFSEKRDKFNKPLYQDTGRKPLWRPS